VCQKAQEIEELQRNMETVESQNNQQNSILREISDRLLTIETKIQTVAWIVGIGIALLAVPKIGDIWDETFSVGGSSGRVPARVHILEGGARAAPLRRAGFDPDSFGGHAADPNEDSGSAEDTGHAAEEGR
jgi:hypothetical protein